MKRPPISSPVKYGAWVLRTVLLYVGVIILLASDAVAKPFVNHERKKVIDHPVEL